MYLLVKNKNNNPPIKKPTIKKTDSRISKYLKNIKMRVIAIIKIADIPPFKIKPNNLLNLPPYLKTKRIPITLNPVRIPKSLNKTRGFLIIDVGFFIEF